MDYVDIYCERVAPGLLDEPINFITNAAFLIAAVVVWPQVRDDRWAQTLCVILATIGLASGAFHSFATSWTGAADSLSILLFILVYLFVATTRIFNRAWVWGIVAVLLFIPYSAAVAWATVQLVGTLNGSFQYVPVPILILGYAIAMRARAPFTARGFVIGALILVASLVFRSIDEAVCTSLPIGTHFMWHVLNGVMLGWMILTLHRARGELALG